MFPPLPLGCDYCADLVVYSTADYPVHHWRSTPKGGKYPTVTREVQNKIMLNSIPELYTGDLQISCFFSEQCCCFFFLKSLRWCFFIYFLKIQRWTIFTDCGGCEGTPWCYPSREYEGIRVSPKTDT